jgi:hypothetical protein
VGGGLVSFLRPVWCRGQHMMGGRGNWGSVFGLWWQQGRRTGGSRAKERTITIR